jgi:hypothetical protein
LPWVASKMQASKNQKRIANKWPFTSQIRFLTAVGMIW